MSKKVKVLISILIIIPLFIGILGFLIAFISSKMSPKYGEHVVDIFCQDTGFNRNAFNEKWEEHSKKLEVTSSLGHTIPIYYITKEKDYNNKTVILVHWHMSNHKVMYPIAELFLQEGWNVVLYDQRAHGENSAATVTFGYLESEDLAQVIDFTKAKNGNERVGVMGQSMGAATIAYYLGSEEAKNKLSFAVLESPYSSMYDEIAWKITQNKIPLLEESLTSLGSIFCKLLYGYSFQSINQVERVKASDTPTLMFHSKVDKVCPYYMGEALFKAISHDRKKFVTFEKSNHLAAFWDEPERYQEELFSFINGIR